MSKASDRAYQAIRTRIIDGTLPSGVHLKEEELAEMCGVSRTPIRDALRRLEAEFFVERADNQRTFVTGWATNEIEDVFALRAMLEGYAAARAAERATDDDLATLDGHHRAIETALEQPGGPDVEAFLAHNRDIHRKIIDIAASDRLSALITRIVEQPIVLRTALSYDLHDLRQSNAEHGELISAIRERDVEWAKAVMAAHIRRAYHVYRGNVGSVAAEAK